MLDWQHLFLAVAALGVLVILLRWTYGSGRRTSLVDLLGVRNVEIREVGHSNEYGLLVAIAAPNTYIEAEMSVRRLEDAGIRVTLVTTADGPRVMVFRENESVARQVLAAG